jgi:AraC-like DNA-binding protein
VCRSSFLLDTGPSIVFVKRERCGATEFLEKPISDAQLFSALDRVFGLTDPAIDFLVSAAPAWPEKIGDTHVRHALRIIERGFSNPDFSVDVLAAAVGITPDHLARLFRAHLGRKPLEQIHESRIEAAKKLLDSSGLSIYEIALDCGYRTTTDFDAWFRHFSGQTPSDWRNRGRKKG